MIMRIYTDVTDEQFDILVAEIDADEGTLTKTTQEDGKFTVTAQMPGPDPLLPAPPTSAPWMAIAEAERAKGVRELRSNPIIEDYFATTTFGRHPDSEPWCSAFVNFCVIKSGHPGTNSALAQSWLEWGVDAGAFVPGCIVVLTRGSAGQGHVGFFVGTDARGSIQLLGGNQSDSVNISSFPNAKVLGRRVADPASQSAADSIGAAQNPSRTGASAPVAGMPLITTAIASQMLPGAHLTDIAANLPAVLEELGNAGLTTIPIVLAAIATIRVETSGFLPINEFISQFNTTPGGAPFDRYDFRSDLGNNAIGDGARYKGRGFVQLTGKDNYRRFGSEIGVDLITDPDQANETRTAAKLLAAFLKAQRTRIEQALARDDFADARKAVNGGVHGLAHFTESYQTGLRLLG